jgi:DNA-binding SARP family transcriptional activator/tetratricopeptide (TPR) repeat protein
MTDDTGITINTLGGLEILDSTGQPLSLGTRKARALLVYLALARGRPQSREHLASLLWGRSADAQARASFRQTLSSIRKHHDFSSEVLRVEGDSVALVEAAVWVDAIVFEDQAGEATVATLERCDRLYRGDFLAGFNTASADFETWQLAQQQRLAELALRSLNALMEQYASDGKHEQCIDIGHKLLAIDPLHEITQQALMRSYVQLGRREAAIKQYLDFETALREELGVEPAASIRALYQDIVNNRSIDTDAVTTPVKQSPAAVSDRIVSKPSIAVLPFANLSGDVDQAYFSDGITDDLIVELSRFRSLTVIARSSSFSFRDQQMDIADIAARLGVDYIVEGSVRRAVNQIRITARLVVAESGEQIWGKNHDSELRDIFAVHDEVVGSIVATLGGRLEDHRAHVRHRTSPNDWSVYDRVLRAQELHYRINKDANGEAQSVLQQAQLQDPQNARIYSLLGAAQLLDYVQHWAKDGQQSLHQALENGRSAVKLDNSDSLAHARLGETLIHFDQFKEARMHFRKALELNPNDSEAIALYSVYFMSVGRPDLAIDELDKVRKMDPYERVWIPWLRGEALFNHGRFDEAIAAFEEVVEPINDLKSTLAACYQQIGETDTAGELLRQYLAVAGEEMPDYPGNGFDDWKPLWLSSAPCRDPAQYRFLLDSLAAVWPVES